MATRIQVTIDCADPAGQAEFWATALGYELERPPEGDDWRTYWISKGVPEDEAGDGRPDAVVDPAGVGPRLWFQQVPEAKAGKNRLHLDLRVSAGRAVPLATRREQVEAAAERLEAAGARRLRVQARDGLDHFGIVLADPEGNEFCLV